MSNCEMSNEFTKKQMYFNEKQIYLNEKICIKLSKLNIKKPNSTLVECLYK